MQLQEKEWFFEQRSDIANARTGAERKSMIEALKSEDPSLYAAYKEALRQHEGISHFFGNSGCFALCGRGRKNLYAVFAECMRTLLNPEGRVGCVLPTGIATDDTTKFFFQDIIEKKSLVSLFDFENKLLIFPAVAPIVKFCLFTSGGGLRMTAEAAEFSFFAHAVDDLCDDERRFTLSVEDIALINPNTRTCPIFRSRRDAVLTRSIYHRVQVLIREAQGDRQEENPWGVTFKQGLFNMTSDSQLFYTREKLESEKYLLDGNIFRNNGDEYLPLYEAKLFHHYNHRPSTFDGIAEVDRFKMRARTNASTTNQLSNPDYYTLPRYWVHQRHVEEACRFFPPVSWFLAYRGMTNVMTNSRNSVFAILPRRAVGNSASVCILDRPELACDFLATVDSFVFDYATRQKLAGGNMNFFIVKQLPVLLPQAYQEIADWTGNIQTLRNWFLPRVLELTYTAWDLESFAQDCGWAGPPFRWDEERRFLIRCELDAAFFYLYLTSTPEGQWKPARIDEGTVRDETDKELSELKRYFATPRDAVDYIMDTFPIVKKKDEEKYGEYRTKVTILQMYDEMAEAIKTDLPPIK